MKHAAGHVQYSQGLSCSPLCTSKTQHFETWTSLWSAPDGLFPIAGIVWCCSPNGAASVYPVPCWLRPGSDVVSACVVLFQAPVCSGEVVLRSLHGRIVTSLWMYACLCYRPVCQDGDSFTRRDLRVPTVVHLSFFLSKTRPECECECQSARLTCSVCTSHDYLGYENTLLHNGQCVCPEYGHNFMLFCDFFQTHIYSVRRFEI